MLNGVPVWELMAGRSETVATLVIPEEDQTLTVMKRFGGDGSPLRWRRPPRLEAYSYRSRKPRPLGDIGPFLPGTLVLGEKAHAALGPFLARFGQLLPIDVGGVPHWFFNATHLVSCIDPAHSEPYTTGTIGKEAFIDAAIPTEAAVFKDPLTARARLYANEAGRRALEALAAMAGVRGLLFVRAGLSGQASPKAHAAARPGPSP